MKKINSYMKLVVFGAMLIMFFACQQPGKNSTGSEFMPDMGHSVAYEANYYTYYYHNTWGTQDEYYKYAFPRQPVKGTIARGYAGGEHDSDEYSQNYVSHTPNGAVPYYYGDNDDERLRATDENVNNPFQITDKGLAQGKDLYNIYCGICHGDAGDGLGYLAREEGKYPVAPTNLLQDEFVNASNGRYYHAIMYGKNMMGAYKNKLGFEERWQVIHYIRSLQAKNAKLEYSQYANTLNSIDMPAGDMVVEEHHTEEVEHEEDHGDEDSHDDHSEGHDDSDH